MSLQKLLPPKRSHGIGVKHFCPAGQVPFVVPQHEWQTLLQQCPVQQDRLAQDSPRLAHAKGGWQSVLALQVFGLQQERDAQGSPEFAQGGRSFVITSGLVPCCTLDTPYVEV